MKINEDSNQKLKELLKENTVEDTHQLLETLITTDINKFLILSDLWVEMHPDDEFIKNLITNHLNPE